MPARTTYYRPAHINCAADDASPEEWEGEVISDLTGEEIVDWDNIWETSDGELCSFEEAIKHAKQYNLTIVTSPEEYNNAKNYLINECGYKEEYFIDSPTIVKVNDIDDYFVEKDIDYEDLLLDLDYRCIDPQDLDWDSDSDYYDDCYEPEDY